jgi:PqqD family protein of HPr-rel-A system
MTYWHITCLSSLRIENWDGEYTVYQPASGKTHFLNEMGLRILTLLDQAPFTLDAICAKLAEAFSIQANGHFQQQISATLQRFEALGLIAKIKKPSL